MFQHKANTRTALSCLLEASKPPEGAAGAGAVVVGGSAAGTGGVGEGREPRVSNPASRRSFCTGAGAKGAKAGTTVGARVGDMRPKEKAPVRDIKVKHPVALPVRGSFYLGAFCHIMHSCS